MSWTHYNCTSVQGQVMRQESQERATVCSLHTLSFLWSERRIPFLRVLGACPLPLLSLAPASTTEGLLGGSHGREEKNRKNKTQRFSWITLALFHSRHEREVFSWCSFCPHLACVPRLQAAFGSWLDVVGGETRKVDSPLVQRDIKVWPFSPIHLPSFMGRVVMYLLLALCPGFMDVFAGRDTVEDFIPSFL